MQGAIFLSINGSQTGPHSQDELLAMWNNRSLPSNAFYWSEGMEDWLLVEDLLRQASLSSPPPLPKQPPPIPPVGKKQPIKRNNRASIVVLLLVAVACGGFYLLARIGSTTSREREPAKTTAAPSPTASLDAQDAYYASRKFIQNRLKSPSTAKFSNILTDSNTGWKELEGDRIRCWGIVEAQNSFGVPLRQTWSTVVQPVSTSKTWDIVYATLDAETLVDIRDQRKTYKILKAEEFIGMTKEQMISLLGEPSSEERGIHPSDGGFTMYKYSNKNGKDTFFTIWDSDQIIDNGMYNGTYFHKK